MTMPKALVSPAECDSCEELILEGQPMVFYTHPELRHAVFVYHAGDCDKHGPGEPDGGEWSHEAADLKHFHPDSFLKADLLAHLRNDHGQNLIAGTKKWLAQQHETLHVELEAVRNR
jgi:hypothetical protein